MSYRQTLWGCCPIAANVLEIMKIRITHAYFVLKQSRWLVFATRVTFNEHNLSIIGTFVEHNRKIFRAVQHSIIGYFLSIIGSALLKGDGHLTPNYIGCDSVLPVSRLTAVFKNLATANHNQA